MNNQIIITPTELIAWVLGICAAIATIGKAMEWASKGIRTIKRPETEQNERIKDHEDRIKRLEDESRRTNERYEQYFLNDKRQLEEIIEGMHILQRVSLATLSHAINGNDIEKLKVVESDLQEYLTGKGK